MDGEWPTSQLPICSPTRDDLLPASATKPAHRLMVPIMATGRLWVAQSGSGGSSNGDFTESHQNRGGQADAEASGEVSDAHSESDGTVDNTSGQACPDCQGGTDCTVIETCSLDATDLGEVSNLSNGKRETPEGAAFNRMPAGCTANPRGRRQTWKTRPMPLGWSWPSEPPPHLTPV